MEEEERKKNGSIEFLPLPEREKGRVGKRIPTTQKMLIIAQPWVDLSERQLERSAINKIKQASEMMWIDIPK